MKTAIGTINETLRILPRPGRIPSDGTPLAAARILLLAGLMAAPLALGAVLAWAWASLATLAALLLVLWGMEQIRHGRVRIVWSPLYLPLLFFLALAVIQSSASLTVDHIAGRQAAIKLATNALWFFVAVQLLARAPKAVWRGIVAAITLFAFALALLAIFQYFSSGGLIFWLIETSSGASFGPYANRNHYAGLMEMLIPIAVGGMLGRLDKTPLRGFFVFAVVVAITSTLLSGSRGGLIALIVEISILGVIVGWFSPGRHARSRWAAAALGVAAAATLFFLIDPGQIKGRLATVTEIPVKPEATLAERALVSRDALRILGDHPWGGVGLGSFAVVHPRYQSFATDRVWIQTHNDYAQALAETGAVGGVLIVAALAMFFPLAFGRLRVRLKHEVGWIQIGAAVGCCGLLVHSLGDFNLHIPANAAWFAVCAAIAVHPEANERSRISCGE